VKYDPFLPTVRENPYPYYAYLRRHAPVYQVPGAEVWVISRYPDVLFVLRNPQIFSSAVPRALQLGDLTPFAPGAPPFIATDPPAHTRVRKLVNRAFTPRRIASLASGLREVIGQLLDSMAVQGICDLIRDLAIPLPIITIAQLLGVLPERSQDFRRWANDFATALNGAAFQPDVVHVKIFLTQLSPLILPLLKDVPSLYHVVWYQAICPVGMKTLPDGTACQVRAGVVCYRNRCLPLSYWLPRMLQVRLWRRWYHVFNLIVANSNAVKWRLMAEGIGLCLFSPRDAHAQPFWSHLRHGEKQAAIIDGPESVIVPGLPGIQLADWATRYLSQRPARAAADPPDLVQEARRVFGRQIMVSDYIPKPNVHADRRLYHRLLERIDKKGALCRHLLRNERFDVVVIGFHEAHDAAHRFWDYRSHADHDSHGLHDPELTFAIHDVYHAIDRQMHLLLAQLPTEANVAVLSCYGMAEQFPTTGLIDAFLQKLGYHIRPEPVAPAANPLAWLRRTLPHSWRAALSPHLPLAMQERALGEKFRNGADWRKTRAFAIPSLYTSFVRVNLRDREPLGIVAHETAYEALLAELETNLKQLVDPRTGQPAVERVDRTTEVFHCDVPTVLPDIFVRWQPRPYFIDQVVHPHADLMQEKPGFFRGSAHSESGFFAVAGSSFRRLGIIEEVALLDLAPTFLSLLNEAIPQKMSGRVMEALLS